MKATKAWQALFSAATVAGGLAIWLFILSQPTPCVTGPCG